MGWEQDPSTGAP